MPAAVFSSDGTDQKWAWLAPLLPAAKPGGRPRSVTLRVMLNGIFYLVRTGCACAPGRYLPRDYGPWSTVHHDDCMWRSDGTWERDASRRLARGSSTRSQPRPPSKGVHAASMGQRRSTGVNATSWWTRLACCSRSWSIQLISREFWISLTLRPRDRGHDPDAVRASWAGGNRRPARPGDAPGNCTGCGGACARSDRCS